ncbi:unnamed protein product, partial [Iphiclides podalirius]
MTTDRQRTERTADDDSAALLNSASEYVQVGDQCSVLWYRGASVPVRSGMSRMGIIIGTCVPDAEPDAAAYGAQTRRPPRRILYDRRSLISFTLSAMIKRADLKTATGVAGPRIPHCSRLVPCRFFFYTKP